ncbi:MAG: MFS transporter [Actinophytocola sp.]|uniref:MFS transporter n=1 Tax=Actinophytocola sp. TaxID=1872138 RepID=UPI003C73BEE0
MAGETKIGLVSPLRVREFRYLWGAELASVAGDQLARVALAVLVYARTSSAALTALTYALTFVPAILGGLLLSGLADRFPRRRVMVVTDVVRAVLAGAMAVPGISLPVLWGLVAVLSAVAAPFKAAQLAVLPQILVDKPLYRAGLSLRQVTAQTAQLVAFGAGGVLMTVLEPHLALLLNAATFVVSAVLVLTGVRERPAAAQGADEPDLTPSGRVRSVWPVFAFASLIGLYVVPEGLAAPYADQLGLLTVGVGVLMAADPVGSVLGGWLAPRLRMPTSFAAATWLSIAAGAPLVVCVLAPGLVLSAVLWAVSGAFSTVLIVQIQELVVQRVPDARRGGVMGRLSTTLYSSQGLAILGGGLVAEAFDAYRAVALAGMLAIVLATMVGATVWVTRSRQTSAGNEPDAKSAHQRSLLATSGTPSPGTDREPDPGLEKVAGDQGSGGDANSPWTSATQHPVPGEGRTRRRRSQRGPRRVRTLPTRPRAFLVGVEIAAAVATGVLAVRYPATAEAARNFAVIVGMGILVAEVTKRVERMRRRFSDAPHVNMSSVWTFSAALVTSPALAAATAVILYVHLWRRSWREITGMHPFRVVFSVCAVVLSCHAAFLLNAWLPGSLPTDVGGPAGLLAIVLVIVTYWVVNTILVGGAISLLRSDRSIGRLVGSWSENAIEYATLTLGALVVLVLAFYPWAVALMPLPLYVLHRSVLVRQLEHEASIDDKTDLLKAGTWQSLASREVELAKRHGTGLGVLMVDIDHFKGVNDRYGHLVGDRALRAVADALRGVVRNTDLVGRFGGEEFVVLLVGTDHAGSIETAKRVCERVRAVRVQDALTGATYPELRLSVSIGVAALPDNGTDLNELLHGADVALFVTKDAGRDGVRAVQPVPHPADHDAGSVGL